MVFGLAAVVAVHAAVASKAVAAKVAVKSSASVVNTGSHQCKAQTDGT